MSGESVIGASLAAILCTLAFGDFGAAQDQPFEEIEELAWTADEVALARHVTNERGFRNVDDGIYIASIHMRMARALGVSVATYIGSTYIRHSNPERRDRRWVAFLDGSLLAPRDWPEADVPWETRGRALWLATLQEARESLSHPPRACGGVYPSTWGSAAVDGERIARMTAPGGGYVRLHCANVANVFLARRR